MSDLSNLAGWALEWGISLSDEQLAQFAAYQAMLQEWSGRLNLTAIHDPQQVVIRHFLDSLTCAVVTGDLSGQRLIDVGSGAGFPGLPPQNPLPPVGVNTGR
ncbi:MAG: RsmG family class I SAM-dependent methyltransferase [Chloroflexota bacterium]